MSQNLESYEQSHHVGPPNVLDVSGGVGQADPTGNKHDAGGIGSELEHESAALRSLATEIRKSSSELSNPVAAHANPVEKSEGASDSHLGFEEINTSNEKFANSQGFRDGGKTTPYHEQHASHPPPSSGYIPSSRQQHSTPTSYGMNESTPQKASAPNLSTPPSNMQYSQMSSSSSGGRSRYGYNMNNHQAHQSPSQGGMPGPMMSQQPLPHHVQMGHVLPSPQQQQQQHVISGQHAITGSPYGIDRQPLPANMTHVSGQTVMYSPYYSNTGYPMVAQQIPGQNQHAVPIQYVQRPTHVQYQQSPGSQQVPINPRLGAGDPNQVQLRYVSVPSAPGTAGGSVPVNPNNPNPAMQFPSQLNGYVLVSMNPAAQSQSPMVRVNVPQQTVPHMQHLQPQQNPMMQNVMLNQQQLPPGGQSNIVLQQMYPQSRVPMQNQPNMPSYQPIVGGNGMYVPQQHAMQSPQQMQQLPPSQPPSQPIMPAAAAVATVPLPAPQPEKKKIVIKDKDGNIVDMSSFKKSAASTQSQPAAKVTAPSPAPVSTTAGVEANAQLAIDTKASILSSEDASSNVQSEPKPSTESSSIPTHVESTSNSRSADLIESQAQPVGSTADVESTATQATPESLSELTAEMPISESSPAISSETSSVFSEAVEVASVDLPPRDSSEDIAPVAPIAVVPVTATSVEEDEDDWEATADKISQGEVPILNVAVAVVLTSSSTEPVKEAIESPDPSNLSTPAPAAAPAQRRLAPGGGLTQQRLNQGPATKSKVAYTKEEILKLRPTPIPERPQGFVSTVSVFVEEGPNKGNVSTMKVTGYWNRGELFRQFERVQQSSSPAVAASSSSSGHHHHNYNRDNHHGNNPYNQPSNQYNSNQHGSGGDRGSHQTNQYWKRMQDNNKGRSRGPVPPRPKKIITDPVQQLSLDATAVLNKMTPQSFDKLLGTLCELNISSNAKLDKLISIIFEFAVAAPHFASMYAELCVALEKESRNWSFIQVAFDEDLGQYFYIRDLEALSESYGPFESEGDCISAVLNGATTSPANQVPNDCVVRRVLVCKDTLMQISATKNGKLYYVTYTTFSEFDRNLCSNNIFETAEEAERDSQKLTCFKRKLVNICQSEFQDSCSSAQEGKYVDASNQLKLFNDTKHELTQNAREAKEADMAEFMLKLKLRKLGNIRFVGEIYKQGLISTKSMQKCIVHLIAVNDADEKFVSWKECPDEQDIELLVKFLQTIGSTLESKGHSLESYFQQIEHLSGLKALDSRIRFNLKDLVDLRLNNWQARRQAEAPKKVEAKGGPQDARQAQLQGKPIQRLKSDSAALGPTSSKPPVGGPAVAGGALVRQSSDSKVTTRASPGPSAGGERGGRGQLMRRSDLPETPSPAQTPKGSAGSRFGGSSAASGGTPGSAKKQQQSSSNRDKASNSGKNDRGDGGSEAYNNRRGGGGTPKHQQQPPSTPSPAPHSSSSSSSSSSAGAAALLGSDSTVLASESDVTGTPSPALQSTPPLLDGDEDIIAYAFTDEEIEKRVHSILEEYLTLNDPDEFHLSMRELPVAAVGPFVLRIMSKYLDTPKADVKKMLEQLLDIASPYFDQAEAMEVVESALKSAECLLALNDACLDCQDAPERLGLIVGTLVRKAVCRRETLTAFCSERCVELAADEYGPPLEELQDMYDKFMVVVDRHSQ